MEGAEQGLEWRERGRREAEAAPVLSSDHRIAWLCGEPSERMFYILSMVVYIFRKSKQTETNG